MLVAVSLTCNTEFGSILVAMNTTPRKAENSIRQVGSNGHEIVKLYELTHSCAAGSKVELYTDSETSPYITTCIMPKTHKSQMVYSPLEFENLYLKFQGLQDTNDILNFADKWGLLGCNVTSNFVESRSGGKVVEAEQITDWWNEIDDMKRVCQLMVMLKAKEVKDLSGFVRRSEGKIWWTQKNRFSISFREDEESKTTWDLIKYDDPASNEALAWLVVQHIANKRLINRLSSLISRSKNGEYVLRVVPVGLIGCLWYQFGIALTNSHGLRVCPKCDSFFVPKHKDTEFCNTPKCKSKQQRLQKSASS